MSRIARRPAAMLALRAPSDGLCLDFANTLAWRGSDPPRESLADFDALSGWLDRAGYPLPKSIDDWAAHHPGRVAALFANAIKLRETIFRCASAIAAGDMAARADLDTLNEAMAVAPSRDRLTTVHASYAWQTALCATPSAPALLAPVLWSAADLLTRADQLRVRRCANDKCLWLFIDNSKTGTRRWCDMASCGNRAKALRHYRRHAAA